MAILRHFSRGVLWWMLWGVSASCMFEYMVFVECTQFLSPRKTPKTQKKRLSYRKIQEPFNVNLNILYGITLSFHSIILADLIFDIILAVIFINIKSA